MSYWLNVFHLLLYSDRLTGGDEWCRGHVHHSSYVRGDVGVDDVLCGVIWCYGFGVVGWDWMRWGAMEWDGMWSGTMC